MRGCASRSTRGWPSGRRRAHRGHDVTVRVEVDAAGLPAGVYEGAILVELLLPDGAVESVRVPVALEKQGVPRYEAGRPRS